MIHFPKGLFDKPKVTREEARKMVRDSLDETIALHKSFRDGTWKPSYNINIVGRDYGE